MLDVTFVVSSLLGCATGYAAIKVEIKFLWRDIRELKRHIAELQAELKKAA